MYNEVIIVEGKNDVSHLKEIIPESEVISVNGSEISNEVKKMIVEISKTRNIVLFFDPDYPGQRIRAIINDLVPNASHAFIKKSDAISKNKKKVGVEHASASVILEALENKLTFKAEKGLLKSNDLFDLKLVGYPNSKNLRIELCNKLHLDNPNGKTFLKRLNMLNLTKKELEEMI